MTHDPDAPVEGEIVDTPPPVRITAPGVAVARADRSFVLDGRLRLTDEVHERIVLAVRGNASIVGAAKFATVAEATVRKWLGRGRDYLLELQGYADRLAEAEETYGEMSPQAADARRDFMEFRADHRREEPYARLRRDVEEAQAQRVIRAWTTVDTIRQGKQTVDKDGQPVTEKPKAADQLRAAMFVVQYNTARESSGTDEAETGGEFTTARDISEADRRLAESIAARSATIIEATAREVVPDPEPEPDPYEPWAATMGLAEESR